MATPRPPLVENWEEFLESNYYLLSRRVRVENLLDHLRSKQILSQDDAEIVLHFATQFMKAGKLVDIIKTRGRPGFEVYMEAIEFEYPDLYLEMTSIQPRQRPDAGKRRSHSRQSELVFAQMGQLVGSFAEQIIIKQSEMRKFQVLVDSLKAELAEERKITEERFRQFEEEKELLVQEKEQLSKRLTEEQLAKKELEKFEKSRADKLNDLYDLSRKSAVLSSMDLNPVSSQAGKPGATDNKNNGTVQLTKNKLHSSPSCDSGVGLRPGDGNRDKKDQVPLPGPDGTDTDLQQTDARLQALVEEFKKEAEQCRKRLAEAEKVSLELAKEKENMKNEARQLEEKCELMADMIRALKNETDNGRKIQKREKKEQTGTFQFPQMFSVNEAGDEKKRSDPSPQNEGPPRLPRSPQCRHGKTDVSELFGYSFNILGGSTDRPGD